MAKFDHERAHMAANLVSDPPVGAIVCIVNSRHMSVLSNVDNTHICIYTVRVIEIRINICDTSI